MCALKQGGHIGSAPTDTEAEDLIPIDKLTYKAQEALQGAQELAQQSATTSESPPTCSGPSWPRRRGSSGPSWKN